MGVIVASLFARSNYLEGTNHWYTYVILIALLIIADAIALPIGKKDNHIVFHHLWRQSTVDPKEIHYMFLSSGGRFKMHQKRGYRMTAFIGKNLWNLYYVNCDNVNGIAQLLEEHTDCKTLHI